MTTPVRPPSDAGDLVKRLEDAAESQTNVTHFNPPGPTYHAVSAELLREAAASIAALSEENERLKAAPVSPTREDVARVLWDAGIAYAVEKFKIDPKLGVAFEDGGEARRTRAGSSRRRSESLPPGEGINEMSDAIYNSGLEAADIVMKLRAGAEIDDSLRQRIVAALEEWPLSYSGLADDLDSALMVLAKRIRGDNDLASAAEWMRRNYPFFAAQQLGDPHA